jgi:hypothetical protein
MLTWLMVFALFAAPQNNPRCTYEAKGYPAGSIWVIEDVRHRDFERLIATLRPQGWVPAQWVETRKDHYRLTMECM